MSDIKKINASQFASSRGRIPAVPNKNSIIREQPPIRSGDLNLDTNQKKNYVVIVKRGMTIDTLEHDLERDTSRDKTVDSNIVPDRVVDVANRRPGSERQTQYWLTDDEAKKLKNHPMVEDVEWSPEENPFIDHQLCSSMNQNFKRAEIFGTAENDLANFALYRCSTSTNTYSTGTEMRADYNYVLDGTGVDVIIMDDGVLTDHPEFTDSNGISRVQQINWYTAAGIAGTMPANFYDDTGSGHATHVAGIVAGKTFGWAKNAKIYSMRIYGGAGRQIDATTAFDLMKLFHRNKPINPATGQKRPTIVNGSWATAASAISSSGAFNPYLGHTLYLGQIWGGSYRGTPWSGYVRHTEYGLTGTLRANLTNTSGTNSEQYQINVRSSTYDSALQDLLDEGVHFIHASGNDGMKADSETGVDYNNYVRVLTGIDGNGQPLLNNVYYHSGTSPHAPNSIDVGSINYVAYTSSLERRAFYSSYGPGIDVWAPGTGIISSYNSGGSDVYYYNNNYKQQNDSGTSMSAPQVAGVLALFLQLSPGASPVEAQKWITNNATTNALYDTELTEDYTDSTSLGGGPNKFLFNPYAVSSVYPLKNQIVIKNGIVKLKS